MAPSPRCYSARPSTATAGTPRRENLGKSGVLATSFDQKFSTKDFLAEGGQASDSIETIVTPRPSRRPIENGETHSDARNPFNRTLSKYMTNVDDMRSDNARAGRRTHNPSMVREDGGASRSDKATTFGYSTTGDWRPGKVFNPGYLMRGSGNPTTLTTPPTGVTENYINDMKTNGNAHRPCASPPSAALRRMKDREVKLPAEMEGSTPRTQPVPSPTRHRPESKRITQNFERDSTQTLLHHVDPPVSSRRFERLERAADKHFDSIVNHMKKATTEQRMYGELFRARGQSSLGVFNEAN